MHRTNLDSLRSCLCFSAFLLSFAPDFFILLLVKSNQLASSTKPTTHQAIKCFDELDFKTQ